MPVEPIATPGLPPSIGTYSPIVRAGDFVFVSGQIPLIPETGLLVAPDFKSQAHQAFKNLLAVLEQAALGSKHVAKLNISLTDLSHFSVLNEVMAEYFQPPYPARAAIGVASLPRGSQIEIEAIAYTG